MSKSTLKKELQKLTKEQLVEQILDLYDKNKAVKEFYGFYLSPHTEKDLFEKYKQVINNEFYPNRGEPKTRFSVCKKAISDFKALSPSPELIADLMLCLVENACKFTREYGDMWEGYYISAENNFDAALKFMEKHNLLENFKLRAEQCINRASYCGWGFCDSMPDIFYEYYQE
ncbi:MAG: DUF6155 family protein [Flavobacteriaceae bacterium]|jgi:hypothetical protein|nr:DUF6155 family protein [Flavobacteriaceae bacterium]